MDWKRIEAGAMQPTCADCHRVIKEGQVGVFQKLGPQHPITHRVLWWHAKCVTVTMEVCPPDNDEQTFRDLRDRIATAGVAFPDMT